jgi:hypothetical protein
VKGYRQASEKEKRNEVMVHDIVAGNRTYFHIKIVILQNPLAALICSRRNHRVGPHWFTPETTTKTRGHKNSFLQQVFQSQHFSEFLTYFKRFKMLTEEEIIPAVERRRASDWAQFVNSFSWPSTNVSRRILRFVISFSSLSFCSTC